MESDLNFFTSTLSQAGLRLTAPRLAICELLSSTTSHPSAAQIYAELKPRYPSLSLATVYNTLDVLVGRGVIYALGHSGDGSTHFEPSIRPHINLACLCCHQIIDFPSDSGMSRVEQEVMETSGYQLLGARILYYGYCPACQNEQAALPASGRAEKAATDRPV